MLAAPPVAPPVPPHAALDRVGVAGSLACAAHCALVPLLAALLPGLGAAWLLSERVGGILLAATAGVALLAHRRGLRHHQRAWPLVVALAGVGVVLAAERWLAEGSWAAAAASGTGGLLVASSHLANLALLRPRSR